MDHFGLVETVDRLGERIVVRIANASHGSLDPGFGQALGIVNCKILRSAVAMMNKAIMPATVMNCLFKGIKDEAGFHVPGNTPSDDVTGEYIDDEGDIDKASPGGTVREIRHPKLVRCRRVELPIDVIERTRCCFVAQGRLHWFAPDHAFEAQHFHESLHRAARHIKSFTLQLPPDHAYAINTEILVINALDFRFQGIVSSGAG